MSRGTSDRNLLVGMLAFQNGFVRREQLLSAMSAWLVEKETPLDEILVRQGALEADSRTLLLALVAKHLAMHDNVAERSLAAISSLGSVREELQSLADPGLNASLAHIASEGAGANGDRFATVAPTVGAPTSQGGRFRILRPHARGGLGEVHVALDTELNREVALKEIQSRHADDPQSRARFTLEAEITGGLEHPSIVPVYGLGTYADGRPYYAMRFIRGDSLAEHIEKFHRTERLDTGERTLELHKLLRRFIDVCEAIQYAHDRGVLHRDLKPRNIMLGKYGETLVVDWGLAKPLGSPGYRDRFAEATASTLADEPPLTPTSGSGSAPTEMGSVVGTPAYMSPEQAAGRLDHLGPASDVYSLGATLYTVLTGRAPFELSEGDVGELLKRVTAGDLLPPRKVAPTVPKPLEAICLKAMALKPTDRYATPAQLRDDLENWLADEPVSATTESLVERSARFVRKHKSWALATAAAVCLVALVAIAAAILINQQKNENVQLAREAQGQLAESLYQQANSLWLGGRIGWRGHALDAIARSAAIQPQARLRDLAVQSLMGSDLSPLAVAQLDDLVHLATLRPDGKQAALVLADKLRIWDFDGRRDRDLSGAAVKDLRDVNVLRYSDDGRRLLIGTRLGNCIVWDASKKQLIWSHAFKTVNEPGLAFGPGSDQVTWSDGERIEVWNWSTGQPVADTTINQSPPPQPPPLPVPEIESTPHVPSSAEPQQPPVAVPSADAADETDSVQTRKRFEALTSLGNWIWRQVIDFRLPHLATPSRAVLLYQRISAPPHHPPLHPPLPASQSLQITPWEPDLPPQPQLSLQFTPWEPETNRPAGRTTVITGQRTPWIIVARGRDKLWVTKLVAAELQPPVQQSFFLHENVFLALSDDERYLIVAHNEPYFAFRPDSVPEAPPPSAEGSEYSPPPPPPENDVPPPAPVPRRLQPLLESSERETSRVSNPNDGVEQSSRPFRFAGPEQHGLVPPEQPPMPMAASGSELRSLGTGPTRPAFISSINLTDSTEVDSMELGLGTVVSFGTCRTNGLLFAAGRARMTAFLRCEEGHLGLEGVWLPLERELTGASSAEDGRRFLTVEGNRLCVWQREGLDYASQLNCRSDDWSQCQLTNGAVRWALVNEWGGSVRLIDWQQERELARFDSLGASAASASADGTAVATIDDRGNLQVFRFERDENGHWTAVPLVWSPASEEWTWSTVAVSADGRWIVTGGYQNPSGVYELTNNRYEFRRFVGAQKSTVYSLALSAVGNLAVAAHLDRRLQLFNHESGKILAERSFDWHAAGMSFSPDGCLLACGSLGGPASLLDARTLEFVGELNAEEVAWSTVFSSGSDRLAVGHRDGTIALWDVIGKQRIAKWKGHDSGVTELMFADDKSLISCDNRGTLRRWHLRAVRRELDRLGLTEKHGLDF